MSCIIKYSILDAHQIINLCGPEHDPVGWTPELIQTRKQKTNERLNRAGVKKFFQNLEQSILQEGFRNPIIVTAGLFSREYMKVDRHLNYIHYVTRIPPEQIHNIKRLITCERLGGSRLYIAQKYNMKIPCIINDFIGLVSDGQVLSNQQEILDCFIDKPSNILLNQKGFMAGGLPHIHMEDYK